MKEIKLNITNEDAQFLLSLANKQDMFDVIEQLEPQVNERPQGLSDEAKAFANGYGYTDDTWLIIDDIYDTTIGVDLNGCMTPEDVVDAVEDKLNNVINGSLDMINHMKKEVK